MIPPPPISTLFPYTTLFRSSGNSVGEGTNNLKENAEKAIKLFGRGYIPPSRPVSPSLIAQPGFKKVDLVWGKEAGPIDPTDRKSTRLNSSHLGISYAVFCLK